MPGLVKDFLSVFQEPRTLILVTSSNTVLEASPSSQVLLGFSQAQLRRTLLTTLVHPCDLSNLLKATQVNSACPLSLCFLPSSIHEQSLHKGDTSSVPFLRGLRSILLASGSERVSLVTSRGVSPLRRQTLERSGSQRPAPLLSCSSRKGLLVTATTAELWKRGKQRVRGELHGAGHERLGHRPCLAFCRLLRWVLSP